MGLRARFIVASAALLGACSLLVQFRDEPDPCADGGCRDATTEASLPTDAGPDALDATEAAPPFDAAFLCKGSDNGWYCGYNSGLNGKAPSPDDLVRCEAGVATIERCDAGCVPYPAGIPDMCNGCNGKQGLFCNGQLGAPGQGVKYLTLCNGGQMLPQMKCTNACAPGNGDASCQ